ncbi:unnamed protein product [Boreogadus saida]
MGLLHLRSEPETSSAMARWCKGRRHPSSSMPEIYTSHERDAYASPTATARPSATTRPPRSTVQYKGEYVVIQADMSNTGTALLRFKVSDRKEECGSVFSTPCTEYNHVNQMVIMKPGFKNQCTTMGV